MSEGTAVPGEKFPAMDNWKMTSVTTTDAFGFQDIRLRCVDAALRYLQYTHYVTEDGRLTTEGILREAEQIEAWVLRKG